MLNLLLTAMLLIMPLLTLRQGVHHNGIITGLWISLFFWGRLHPVFSLIVFSVALINFFFITQKRKTVDTTYYHRKTSLPQFFIFLSAMIIFCALSETFLFYGQILGIESEVLQISSYYGFFSSIAGPVIFGTITDKKGPFPAIMILIITAAAALAVTACSGNYPIIFPLGQILLWLSVSGCYTVLPLFTRIYFGEKTLYKIAPAIILYLTLLWGIIHYWYHLISSETEIVSSIFMYLIILPMIAAAFSFSSWNNRFELIRQK